MGDKPCKDPFHGALTPVTQDSRKVYTQEEAAALALAVETLTGQNKELRDTLRGFNGNANTD